MRIAALLVALGLSSGVAPAADPPRRPNVLFLAVDDLRPQLGCYGDASMKTPNIDRLAASGLLFSRAYCQQAVCSPSRTSLLTGLRPDSTRVYDLETHFRTTIPDAVSLPERFKAEGYATESLGKVFHSGLDDPKAWTTVFQMPPVRQYHVPENRPRPLAKGAAATEKAERGPAFEIHDDPDDTYPDGAIAAGAVKALGRLKGKPFFLAVGFLKPHLPFVSPKKYWDLYDHASLAVPPNAAMPAGAPAIAGTTWGELRSYRDIPQKGPLADSQALDLIHAYRACVSFTDAQIGRVLDELDRLGLAGDTIVVLWGDHGWKLGEHGLWSKHTNFELDARVPLILRAPDGRGAGRKTSALVELVDVYPTLCELAGIAPPDGLEGTSLAPLLASPDRPWKTAAFSQYPRGQVMGYSLRDDRHRYTEWQDRATHAVRSRELYDHVADPGENTNLAALPDRAGVVQQLSARLKAGWRAARPAP